MSFVIRGVYNLDMDKFFEKMERLGFSRSGLVLIGVVLALGAFLYIATEPKETTIPKPPAPPAQTAPPASGSVR